MSGSTVEVDTGADDELREEDEMAPDVVPEDSSLVTIDTIQNDMDRLVESAPPKPKKPKSPAAAQAPPPLQKPKPRSPAKEAKEAKPAAAAGTPVQKMLAAKPSFMDAMRGTLPASPAETPAEAAATPPPPEESSEVPEGEDEDDDEEEEESDEGTSISAESSEDSEPEPPAKAKKAGKRQKAEPQNGFAADPLSSFAGGAPGGEDDEEPEEEEEVDEEQVKLQLLEESAALMSEGFLPAQQPTYAMPLPTLKKIVEQQENMAAEQFGIGLIGFGWVEIIRLVESANRAFDPAAKVLGPGKSLRLDGATEAVAKNIRRYRGPFRYLWKKMQTKKLEEYSPLITMGLVTYDILKEVHKENVRKELVHNAQAAMRPTPASMAASARYAQPAGVRAPSYRTPSEAPPQPLGHQAKMPGETSTPASVVSAVAQDPMMPSSTTTQPSASSYEGTYAAAEAEAPRMIPVDQIRIPESDNDEPAAATSRAGDDDDVVVAVPAPAGGSAKRGGSRRRR